MSYSLTEIYTSVLRKTQFSITGHPNIEEVIHDFLENLSATTFIQSEGIPVAFFIGGFLKVKDRNTWELEDFKSFYCNFLENSDKVEVMSFYYYLNFKNKEVKAGTSRILAKLFMEDVDFRVRLVKETECGCFYRDNERVIDISVPEEIINPAFRPSAERGARVKKFRDHFIKAFENQHSYLIADKDKKANVKGNVLTLNPTVLDNPKIEQRYEELYHLIFDAEKVEIIKQSLLSELMRQNQREELPCIQYEDMEKVFSELCQSVIAICFPCAYFNCDIEYMMSIGRVHEHEGKTYARNIGGLILGYKSGHDLHIDHRVLLNLISDRLTAVVAGDFLNTVLKIDQREKVFESWLSSRKGRKDLPDDKKIQEQNKNARKRIDQITSEVDKGTWKNLVNEVYAISDGIWNDYLNSFVEGKFSLEKYKTINFDKLIFSDKGPLRDFIICRCVRLALYNFKAHELVGYQVLSKKKHISDVYSFRTWHCFKEEEYLPLPEEESWLAEIKRPG